jgi:hypothetical protein
MDPRSNVLCDVKRFFSVQEGCFFCSPRSFLKEVSSSLFFIRELFWRRFALSVSFHRFSFVVVSVISFLFIAGEVCIYCTFSH